MDKSINLTSQSFVDYLIEKNYDAETINCDVSGIYGVRIGSDQIQNQDIPESKYAALYREYVFRLNKKIKLF